MLSFVRRNDQDKVFAVINLSDAQQTLTFADALHHGTYTEHLTGATVTMDESTQLTLEPWAHRVLVR